MPGRSIWLVLASSESFAGQTRAGYHSLEQVKRPLEDGRWGNAGQWAPDRHGLHQD